MQIFHNVTTLRITHSRQWQIRLYLQLLQQERGDQVCTTFNYDFIIFYIKNWSFPTRQFDKKFSATQRYFDTYCHGMFLERWNMEKRSFQHLTTFFMSTWSGDSKNMEEIEFSRWLFEGRLRQGKNVLPDGLNWLC